MRARGRKLLTALGAALWAPACVSTNLQAGDNNHPPRIAYNQVDPKPGLVVISDTTTQLPMTFRVNQFEEPDEGDTLTVRWFVDYYRNHAIYQSVPRPPEPLAAAQGLRAGNTFRLTASMLEPNPTIEPHLVEVIICDRAFDDRDDAPEPGRTCAGGDALGTLVSWTVQVTTARAGKPMAMISSPSMKRLGSSGPASTPTGPAPTPVYRPRAGGER